MDISTAHPRDAACICTVVRRSIIELCTEDHGDDPAILEPWLANKTPANVEQWIANPANTLLTCIESGALLGVGCVRDGGEITLNYVSPDARFRGVSTAMVAALEAAARARGHRICVLESTATARRFYLGQGYAPSSAPGEKFGLKTYPMIKPL
ncbi:MAG TPA: GNAT family N-acetyltransferase [Caulobacteraceae bacterium]